MTYIQSLLCNLEMIGRLIDVLTPQDLERKDAKDLFRILQKRKVKCERLIEAYNYQPNSPSSHGAGSL